jgi:hypothetical protein
VLESVRSRHYFASALLNYPGTVLVYKD